MKKAPVTIKDIAKSLKISISTVSRALRGMPEIHPDTRPTACWRSVTALPTQLCLF
ncbi:MAG: LacI family DNA-binding transcriptional regulator [Rudanella sp.]|nr:LacI family DNA-binding transcriptional regulator [Rudanella sp.]